MYNLLVFCSLMEKLIRCYVSLRLQLMGTLQYKGRVTEQSMNIYRVSPIISVTNPVDTQRLLGLDVGEDPADVAFHGGHLHPRLPLADPNIVALQLPFAAQHMSEHDCLIVGQPVAGPGFGSWVFKIVWVIFFDSLIIMVP